MFVVGGVGVGGGSGVEVVVFGWLVNQRNICIGY